MTSGAREEVAPTGVPGLDVVLRGGLPPGHFYLVEGDAGAGKTTLGLQFLLEGARRGERTLWVSLSETEAQLRSTALAHNWDLSPIEFVNLSTTGSGEPDGEYSFFSPADIELNDVMTAIINVVDRAQPQRVVFDPFSDVRLLARDALRYRRLLLQLREHFDGRGCTVLLIQERIDDSPVDPAAAGIVQGIISLYQHSPEYGGQRRKIRVLKLRGANYLDGYHEVKIKTGGLRVYQRLVAADHALPPDNEEVSSGIEELDRMLGGGIERGSSLLVLGPAGVGKSTLCSEFALAAAGRGERAAIFLFDETERAFLYRGEGLNRDVQRHVDSGLLEVRQVDPAEFSPGEFAHEVRRLVEEEDVKVVAIDSLNGYLTGMPDERHLPLHMHELLTYLSYRNVLAILTMNQHGFMGAGMESPVDVSYLADAALVLRYFESAGAVRRAASVVKRRCGPHEVHIRELTIDNQGVHMGEVLTEFRGVLSGQPVYVGDANRLVQGKEEG